MDDRFTSTAVRSREDGVAHRVNIALRFAQRIAAGDAVFMALADGPAARPHTVAAGQRRDIGGFNRWMLMQVMRDQQWRDPRFFTATQVRAAGWSLSPEARPVVLQFVNAVAPDHVLLAVPEVKRFEVFNAGFVSGCGAPVVSNDYPLASLEAAMMATDFEPGGPIAPALLQWIDAHHRELGGNSGGQEILSRAMAATTIASHLDLAAADRRQVQQLLGDTRQWSDVEELLRRDPSAFYEAVRESDLLAGQALTHIRLADQQLMAEEAVVRARASSTRDLPLGASRSNEQGHRKMENTQDRPAFVAYAKRVEAMFAEREAVLAVPFDEREQAHALGAVYFGRQKLWFVPKGLDVSAFKQWNPQEHSLGITAGDSEVLGAFAKEMEAMGLVVPDRILADNAWHNVRVHGNKGYNRSGAYRLAMVGGSDGGPVGSINNKFSGESRSWTYDGPMLTQEQKARMRAEAMRRSEKADREMRETQDVAAGHAADILAKGVSAKGHPYLVRKGIEPTDAVQVLGKVLLQYPEFLGDSGKSAIRQNQQYLIVPMRTAAGVLRAVQAISEDGSVKSFMRGAQKKGTMAILGASSLEAVFHIARASSGASVDVGFVEGYATGASLQRASGMPVVVCFDAGNLEQVAAMAAAAAPAKFRGVIGADNDQFHVERALGFLAENLGLNPNAASARSLEVLSGPRCARSVPLGDVIADGQWHQAPHGRYRLQLEHEGDSSAVHGIKIDATRVDGSPMRAYFNNRGVQAGRNALASFEARRPQDGQQLTNAVLMVPEFRRLDERPTDWNDLAQLEGPSAVTRHVLHAVGQTEVTRTFERQRDAQPERAATDVSR